MTTTKKFTFFWCNGNQETLTGETPTKALENAEYAVSDIVSYVNFFITGETSCYKWNGSEWILEESQKNTDALSQAFDYVYYKTKRNKTMLNYGYSIIQYDSNAKAYQVYSSSITNMKSCICIAEVSSENILKMGLLICMKMEISS